MFSLTVVEEGGAKELSCGDGRVWEGNKTEEEAVREKSKTLEGATLVESIRDEEKIVEVVSAVADDVDVA